MMSFMMLNVLAETNNITSNSDSVTRVNVCEMVDCVHRLKQNKGLGMVIGVNKHWLAYKIEEVLLRMSKNDMH